MRGSELAMFLKTSESIMANELKQIKPFAKIILYSHRLAWLLED